MRVNIVYDFDGTLTKTRSPKYLILEKCGYKEGTQNEKFKEKVKEIEDEKKCGKVIAFFEALFEILESNNLKVTEREFCENGAQKISYNNGLDEYFENLNNLAKENDIEINNFIVTSGAKVFIQNSKYEKYFKDVFGCTFKIKDGFISGIEYCLTFEEKIKQLELLQKNPSTKAEKTIYIGDGITDYYAMKYIHNNNGKTILVHQNENDLDVYNELNKEKIVDYCEIADYGKDSKLYKIIKNEILGE